jgi:phytanoyl-CoA hydroxylase
MHTTLTTGQLQEYHERGFVVLPAIFADDECKAVIDHMMDLKSGRKALEGFTMSGDGEWGRTHNQHLYDSVAMDLLLDPRLRQPLADCFGCEAAGIQTMYFWKGSEQHWHQDQYYLPSCMSAWIPLVDVGSRNGTIWVQPGSHSRHLLQLHDLKEKYGDGEFKTFDDRYNAEIDALVDLNRQEAGLIEEPVHASAGDVVLFHGRLIHRGGPVEDPEALRNVMANHYMPRDSDSWPFGSGWPRIDFDGNRR